MARLSETPAALTSYTLEIPDEVWEDWKDEIPRKYSPLGEGIVPLIAADALCRDREGKSLVAVLVDHGHFTEDELSAVMQGGLGALDDTETPED